MSKQWEYKTITQGRQSDTFFICDVDLLKSAGEEGWELSSVFYENYIKTFYFKRPIEEPSQCESCLSCEFYRPAKQNDQEDWCSSWESRIYNSTGCRFHKQKEMRK